MAANDKRLVLLDAGPLIHLDELGELELFRLFDEILIPGEVWQECLEHRPTLDLSAIPNSSLLGTAPQPSPELTQTIQRVNLGRGESAALAWLESLGKGLLASDDLAARRTAESIGRQVVGTLGILAESCHRGLRSKLHVESVLKTLRVHSTLHVSDALVLRVIASLASLPSK